MIYLKAPNLKRKKNKLTSKNIFKITKLLLSPLQYINNPNGQNVQCIYQRFHSKVKLLPTICLQFDSAMQLFNLPANVTLGRNDYIEL